MIKKIPLIFIVLLIQACASSQEKINEYHPSKLLVQNYFVPQVSLDKISHLDSVTENEVKIMMDKFAQDDNDKITSKAIAESETNDVGFYCGLIIESEADRLYREGTKLRVVGVTEKWIPINGESKKVLHLKLSP
ncbi:hypothetical protein [Aurantivibrio plasticivorans]